MRRKGKKTSTIDQLLVGVNPDKCIFCYSDDSTNDGGFYGPLIRYKEEFVVHYFCMLFASGLYQRGDMDNEADVLSGFLRDDVLRERRRALKLRCTFCKEPGAPTGCVERKCSTKYHFSCGRKNGVLFQFFGSFNTFCADHRPVQQLRKPQKRLRFLGYGMSDCLICKDPVYTRTTVNILGAPCCKLYYHRQCVQAMASTSGREHFKCPMCNNVDVFRTAMLTYGIYLPDRDAAWELEPNAFQDQYTMYSHCDVEECLNPAGRTHHVDEDGHDYEIVRCLGCGSQAAHWKCNQYSDVFRCIFCLRHDAGNPENGEPEIVDLLPDAKEKSSSLFTGAAGHMQKRKINGDSSPLAKRQKLNDDAIMPSEMSVKKSIKIRSYTPNAKNQIIEIPGGKRENAPKSSGKKRGRPSKATINEKPSTKDTTEFANEDAQVKSQTLITSFFQSPPGASTPKAKERSPQTPQSSSSTPKQSRRSSPRSTPPSTTACDVETVSYSEFLSSLPASFEIDSSDTEIASEHDHSKTDIKLHLSITDISTTTDNNTIIINQSVDSIKAPEEHIVERQPVLKSDCATRSPMKEINMNKSPRKIVKQGSFLSKLTRL